MQKLYLYPVRSALAVVGLFAISSIRVNAQTATAPISASSQTSMPNTSLALAWSDTLKNFDFTVKNSSAQALMVIGVQSTANLFVTDFPKTIPANGTAVFSLLFSASGNSTGPTEFLHVLTDHGDRVYQFDHNRAQVAQISPNTLQWNVGDPLISKTFTLTIAGDQAVVAGVTTSGFGNNATVTPAAGGQYIVTVTPGSTDKENKFIVALTLNPTLPGVVPVIVCSVGQQ